MKAIEVSKYIIKWYNNNNIEITNLRLQKLLYFVQGEYCAKTRKKLIDEDFIAYDLGPVIPKIRDYFSIAVPLHISNLDYTILAEEEINIINNILFKYSNYSTWDLVYLSQEEDPWKYNYKIFGKSALIPYESIKRFYCNEW